MRPVLSLGPTVGALAMLAALGAPPALAQQAPVRHNPAVRAGTPPGGPIVAGRLQKTHDGWRSSRIVGANVYNDSNQSIGTVNDLIVGDDGKVTTAVISVGGFLGIGSKLVAVPYDQLHFEQADNTAPTLPPGAAMRTAVAPGTGTGTVPPGAGVAPPPAGAVMPGAGTSGATTTGTGPISTVAPTGPTGPVAPTLAATTPPNVTTTRIVLQSATKASLTSMAPFQYGS
ncbi:MAG: PRC-barrel domain-containing protein [Acidisphaera sp.]|nr:PRC-barrel domain-containing protein [Acidisphaera sp.]